MKHIGMTEAPERHQYNIIGLSFANLANLACQLHVGSISMRPKGSSGKKRKCVNKDA